MIKIAKAALRLGRVALNHTWYGTRLPDCLTVAEEPQVTLGTWNRSKIVGLLADNGWQDGHGAALPQLHRAQSRCFMRGPASATLPSGIRVARLAQTATLQVVHVHEALTGERRADPYCPSQAGRLSERSDRDAAAPAKMKSDEYTGSLMDPLLLGDDPLSGAIGVQRWLTTERNVHLVNVSSFPDALAAVEAACNVWGGAYHLLVPVPDGATTIPEPWRTLVVDTDPARTAVRGRLSVPPLGEQPRFGGT
jgi:hypothetical protein